MRVLIVGSLGGALGEAGRMAIARGARLDQADDIDAALVTLRASGGIDLVLVDLAHDVGRLVGALAAERMAVPVVACKVAATAAEARAAIHAGAREFLPLPPDADAIAALLAAATGADADSVAPIAIDPAMSATVRRAEQVAVSDASILITGESGTGKEVIARHIHRRSRRAAGPFVALNCAALPETLLESELFGHEKGAFSGALARRVGKFEAAQGGTLLLDEVSEMDPRLQAKLLRALQEREIDRLGGASPVRVDVRILATSNRNLPREVAQGRFREDLFFRLDVVSLRVPSLRERPGDVEPLAALFARKYADANGLPRRPLSRPALGRLLAHSWRGNVRELENTIHRAVLLAVGAQIGPEAIELSEGSATNVGAPDRGAAALAVPVASQAGALVGRRMEDVERDLILGTLDHTFGNRTHAATMLGISIRALRNKLRDYTASGLAVPPPRPHGGGPTHDPTGADSEPDAEDALDDEASTLRRAGADRPKPPSERCGVVGEPEPWSPDAFAGTGADRSDRLSAATRAYGRLGGASAIELPR